MKTVKIDKAIANRLDKIATVEGITRDEAAVKCLRLSIAECQKNRAA
jgi:predicted transcriptional regulator